MEPCRRCQDSRFVTMPKEEWPPGVFQPMIACPECHQSQAARRKEAETDRRLKSVWAGLTRVAPAKRSPLLQRVEEDLLVRSNLADLRAHVAFVARSLLATDPSFTVRVCTDIDLVAAWLYSAEEVGDADASVLIEQADSDNPLYKRLPDLVNPPDLLVLRLGLKLAPNRALPSLVLETLHARQHLDRPTWVVVPAGNALTAVYPCYSPELMDLLSSWPSQTLSKVGDAPEMPTGRTVTLPQPAPKQYMPEDRLVNGGGDRKKPRFKKG